MKRNLIRNLCIIIFFSHATLTFGQEKYESEHRLNENEVPENAKVFVSRISSSGNIHWYWEEGLNRTSIEAKFKHDKLKYSVEFDTTGVLEDVEIEIAWSSLDETLKKNITAELSTSYKKFKVRKVQIQYSGTENDVMKKLKGEETELAVFTLYELVVKCKNEKGVNLVEFLFDNQGKLISKHTVIFKNSSNLEY
ncbi:MAG: hypothetical protein MK078_17320 [Crocinitomicaceae bacterium]|nr:hypothetical protein [Crocinitomicaceae bacterium]